MEQFVLFKDKLQRRKAIPKEWKLTPLRECPVPQSMVLCDTPEIAAAYWRMHIIHDQHYDPARECMIVIMLNTRRRIQGHHFVSIGTMDTLLVHPREIFRAAIASGFTSSLILMHSHPSGDPTPSEADIKVTRDLIRAGQLLKIEVLDHVIVGTDKHSSLRELGYFY